MNLTIAIPVHQLKNKDSELLNRALESLDKQLDKNFKALLYINKDVKYKIPKSLSIKVERVDVEEDFSYQRAVNQMAQKHVTTDWFSVLEFDDVFKPTYVSNFYEHLNYYEGEYDMYLNIVAELNAEGNFLSLRNDTSWLVQNMKEIGVLDLETVKAKFQNISLVGTIYNKELFLEIGGLKTKFPIFFNYEYVLRALHSSHEIYVIPKIIVNHTNLRENSYFDLCDKKYSDYDKKEFYNFVTKEYIFKEDRDIADMNKRKESNLKVIK